MLVLSRGNDEEVVIDCRGVRIVVAVTEIVNMNKVRLGFQAPDDAVIHRREVHDAIQREQAAASKEG